MNHNTPVEITKAGSKNDSDTLPKWTNIFGRFVTLGNFPESASATCRMCVEVGTVFVLKSFISGFMTNALKVEQSFERQTVG